MTKYQVDKSKCIGCGACIAVCPVGAISFDENGKSGIDQSKCIKCGACEQVCPVGAISHSDGEGEANEQDAEADQRYVTFIKMCEAFAVKENCLLNPDTAVVKNIFNGLEKNRVKHGAQYCPCRVVFGDESDKEKICPCAWCLEEVASDGHCKCNLFVKKA